MMSEGPCRKEEARLEDSLVHQSFFVMVFHYKSLTREKEKSSTVHFPLTCWFFMCRNLLCVHGAGWGEYFTRSLK